MQNKTKNSNQNSGSEQNQNENQEKPKNFWQRLKLWQKVGVMIFAGGIIICAGYLTAYFSFKALYNKTVEPVNQKGNEFYCEIDNNCIPFVFECGECPDNTIAINKNYIEKYQEKYWDKCRLKGYRDCDAIPSGISKCVNNKCEIVEHGHKAKLLQSAEILEIQYPLDIIKIDYYSDGGTTGVTAKDAKGKYFLFCLDGRMQIEKTGKEIKPYHIYIGAIYPINTNAQKIPIAGKKEKALLNILQDWINKQILEEEQTRLLNIRTVVGLPENELKIYRILKIIEELENRDQIINDQKFPNTSDWQTYRNEELGFEFKYPKEFSKFNDYSLLEDRTLSLAFKDNKFNIFDMRINPGGMLTAVNDVLLEEEVINVDTIKANKKMLEDPDDKRIILIVSFLKNPNLKYPDYYYFRMMMKEKDKNKIELFNQILSSFKFIEKDEIE